MRRAPYILVLLFLSFACTGAALAQEPTRDAEARSLFDAGKAAFADGRFEDALARFREAYELSERPELLYNVASSLDRLGRIEEAAEHYERYLEELPDAVNRNYVARRLDLIAEQTEGAEAASDTGEADAADPREPDDEDGAGAEVEEDATGRGGEPASGPEPISEPAPAPAPAPSRVAPITLFAVGGGAAAGALVTGLMANAKYSDLEDTCSGGRCPEEARSDRDSLGTLTLTTDVLLGVAAASAAVGVVLWVLGSGDAPDEAGRVRARVGCSGEGCSAGATVAF